MKTASVCIGIAYWGIRGESILNCIDRLSWKGKRHSAQTARPVTRAAAGAVWLSDYAWLTADNRVYSCCHCCCSCGCCECAAVVAKRKEIWWHGMESLASCFYESITSRKLSRNKSKWPARVFSLCSALMNRMDPWRIVLGSSCLMIMKFGVRFVYISTTFLRSELMIAFLCLNNVFLGSLIAETCSSYFYSHSVSSVSTVLTV